MMDSSSSTRLELGSLEVVDDHVLVRRHPRLAGRERRCSATEASPRVLDLVHARENAESWISSPSSSRPEPTSPSRREADVLAEPGRGPRCVRVASDARRRTRRAAPPPRALASSVLDRVEQVAVEQLRVEARERVRPRHVVEADPVAEREQRAGLARLRAGTPCAARRGRSRARRRCPRCAPVGEWTPRRVGLARDLVPDRALGDAARERRGGEPLAPSARRSSG